MGLREQRPYNPLHPPAGVRCGVESPTTCARCG
jgi:hypothetical protein